jgi:hypothetical protein
MFTRVPGSNTPTPKPRSSPISASVVASTGVAKIEENPVTNTPITTRNTLLLENIVEKGGSPLAKPSLVCFAARSSDAARLCVARFLLRKSHEIETFWGDEHE